MYDGGHTAFIYSGGLLSEVDEPGGRRVLVTHTGTDLTGVTNADGGLRTMTYDATHHLATDPWGVNSAAYGYDAATGVLVSITLGNGQTLAVSPAFGARAADRLGVGGVAGGHTITDGLGRVTSLVLDGLGRLPSATAPDGSTTSETLDFAGDATSATNGALGHTTDYVYAYGPAGNGDLTQVTNADGTTEKFQYNTTFNEPTSEVDADGNRTTMTYDPTTGLLLTSTSVKPHDHLRLLPDGRR